MQKLQWERLEGKYWKPESDVQYLVEFANPRIEEKTFSDSNTPKTVIVLDVLGAQRDNAHTLPDDAKTYNPPKEFSTRNITFIQGIKPILEAAVVTGAESVMVMLRRTGSGKDIIYNINDAGFIKKYRR